MDRQRTLLALGIGTVACLVISGLLYSVYSASARKIRKAEVPLPMKDAPAGDTDGIDETDKIDEIDKIDASNGPDGLEELQVIAADSVRGYRSLHSGHIDAVQCTQEDGGWHDMVLQYCPHGHATALPAINNKLFGKPVGRVVFDDGSAAILYRGDAAYALFGHTDRADRLVVLTAILHDVLQALVLLHKHRHKMDFAVLRDSIVVNSAGKPRLLGLHAIEDSHDIGDQQIIDDFVRLCDLCLHDHRWDIGGEREQAARLYRSISGLTTVQGIEKKLIPGHWHQHISHRH